MASVEDALFALEITEWVVRGEPTSETEFNAMFRKITSVDSSGRGVESANTSDFGVTWSQITAKQTELNNAAPMAELRNQRDAKIAATDFYALSDVTMSEAWKTYRQSLRDLPASSSPSLDSSGALTNVTWPTKPS